MNLNEILIKTKKKSEKIRVIRKPPSIAMDDRPYSIQEITIITPNVKDESNNKSVTNRQQTDNKPTTKQQQTDNKSVTNRQQRSDILLLNIESRQQTDNKSTTEPTTGLATNRQQIGNKPTTIVHFSSLVGLQRELLIYIYNECKSARIKTTDPITLEHLSSVTGHSKGTVKTTLQRIVDKGCILRKEFKIGRGGWSKYEIPELLYHELLRIESDNKAATKWQQTDNKPTTKPTTESATDLPSSSSNDIKTTTTAVPENWSNLDTSLGQQFGFTKNHLIQLYKHGGLEPKLIQESIQHFAFDLEKNNKAKEIKTNPLSYFMGILKRVGVYTPPDNYESPQDQAIRLYLEKQKVLEAKRAVMEKELLMLSFQTWVNTLTDSDKEELIPAEVKKLGLEAPKNAALRTYFEKTLWPSERAKLMDKILNEAN